RRHPAGAVPKTSSAKAGPREAPTDGPRSRRLPSPKGPRGDAAQPPKAAWLPREAFGGAGAGGGGHLLAVLRWRRGHQRVDEPAGDGRDLVDGGVERRLVRLRGRREAAQLADE